MAGNYREPYEDKPSAKMHLNTSPYFNNGSKRFLGTNLAVFLRNMYTVIPHSHRTALQFTAENGVECDLSSERNIRMDLFKNGLTASFT
ncbi:MAG: hypothetical protein H7A34_01395 [bacterium]|nr:hypothetical protein [bacterium]